jgi:c-di-GMP phosphodiesterase
MNKRPSLARQPILNVNEEIFAYEFYYRDEEGKCSFDDPRRATSSVLVNLLNQIGTKSSIGDHLAFINTDGPLLLTDIIRTLPKDKFVFELTENMRHTLQIHDAIRYYHSLGYRFALDNASFSPEYFEKFAPIFECMEFAKFDVNQTDIEQLNLRPNPYGRMKLIAQRIEFLEVFEAYRMLGFHYFQGFYFAKSHLITHNHIDPKNGDVLSIFSLLQSDASFEEIYTSFNRQSALSLQLIQFLSSTTPEHLDNALSIKEMIERMGKNAFMQWLLLIIYSKSGTSSTGEVNECTLLSQKRVDLMLELLTLASPKASPSLIESARLVALYSLLENLLNIPLEQIIYNLHPNDEIKDALLVSSGILGRVYTATVKLENKDIVTASLLLKSYGVTQKQLEMIMPLQN